MARATFTDPAGVVNGGAAYEWPIGFDEEDAEKNSQNLEETALTTGEGFVRQQGAPSPKVKSLKGWIIEPAQKAMMEDFYEATFTHTITFTDLDGTSHQVIITDWEPQRKIGSAGGTGLGYVWRYTLVMEVIS